MPTKITLHTGVTAVYDPPIGGEGWVFATVGRKATHVYCRNPKHGGGVFIDLDDGNGLVVATTGEKTVRFNNRLWTLTEEQEHVERIKAQDTQ